MLELAGLPIQLVSSDVFHFVLDSFGQPVREVEMNIMYDQ